MKEVRVAGLGSPSRRIIEGQVGPHFIKIGGAMLPIDSWKELWSHFTQLKFAPVDTLEPFVLFDVIAPCGSIP